MNALKNPTKKVDRKPFTEFFKLLEFGNLEAEATDALNDMVHACTETGKTGELTIKIKLKPIGGKAGQVELDSDVKVKLPQPVRSKTLMFATPDNNLQRENPRQQTLDGLKTPAQEAEEQHTLRTAPKTDEKGTDKTLRSAIH
ncbi:hypothetical protein [Ottowia sp. VDI28]|uniref:hypothetical protein n=1 Tax=Ottowia sp. VDI28 TaxID=3133968 RepID=UPI003C30BD0F